MGASGRMQVRGCALAAAALLVVHVAVTSAYSADKAQREPSKPDQGGASASAHANQANSQEKVEDIVKDTMRLLDVLDAKLTSVSNRTASALMRDNLRALEEPNGAARSEEEEEESLDWALARTADESSSSLSSSAPLVSAQAHSDQSRGQQTEGVVVGPRKWSARQLVASEELQTASDSTERHIKFTLDLMQAIFAAQSYSSKSNQIESFLISPLSIQMVLMMMHLGARGQTRRELANCLHLLGTGGATASAPTSGSSGSSNNNNNNSSNNKTLALASDQQKPLESAYISQSGSKLKRRHHQSAANEGTAKSAARPPRQPQQAPSSQQSQPQQPQSPQQQPQSAHELFSAAARNLLKDASVTKALTSANQILVQRNLPLAPHYDWAVRHYYAADVRPVDFQHQSAGGPAQSSPGAGAAAAAAAATASAGAGNGGSQASEPDANNVLQMVNEWVERQTRGRISNLLTAPVPSSTLLMAVNALFFKGDWQYRFDPADTEMDAPFTQADGRTVRLPMMVNRLPVAFAHDPVMRTSVIELPYKAQRLGLFLLLPDDVGGIFHTMQTLNSTSFANLIASMRKPSQTPSPAAGNSQSQSQSVSAADAASNGINVRIPKFSIEASPRLSQVLSQQLGLKTLFSPDVADLSGMFAQPKRSTNNSTADSASPAPSQAGLDELVHKAVLQVDEQGSVAAAASATIVERVGLFNSNYFEADHPFLLFLMDKQTGLVLFSGVFAGDNPSAPTRSAGPEPSTTNQRRHQQPQRSQ